MEGLEQLKKRAATHPFNYLGAMNLKADFDCAIAIVDRQILTIGMLGELTKKLCDERDQIRADVVQLREVCRRALHLADTYAPGPMNTDDINAMRRELADTAHYEDGDPR